MDSTHDLIDLAVLLEPRLASKLMSGRNGNGVPKRTMQIGAVKISFYLRSVLSSMHRYLVARPGADATAAEVEGGLGSSVGDNVRSFMCACAYDVMRNNCDADQAQEAAAGATRRCLADQRTVSCAPISVRPCQATQA
eukprot:121899-Pleurochrysis_carterae.AAC.3